MDLQYKQEKIVNSRIAFASSIDGVLFLVFEALEIAAPNALFYFVSLLLGILLVAFLIVLLTSLVAYYIRKERKPTLFVLLLALSVLLAHLYIINTPQTQDCTHVSNQGQKLPGCVMDEVYYVPAALDMLSKTSCSLEIGGSCNPEHPFLSKAFIAAGIYLFGNTAFGWRIFNVILGTLSIPIFFILLRKMTKSKMPYFATLLLASDMLFFVHSSIAVIDVPSIFFALVGFLFYFHSSKISFMPSEIFSGIFLGLSFLSKETGAFFILTVVIYHLIKKKSLRSLSFILGSSALTSILLLQYYDSFFVSGSPLFYQHLLFIVNYASGLRASGWTGSLINKFIEPDDWIIFYMPIGYFVTNVTINPGNVVYTSVGYFGITNMAIVWMIYAWIPLLGIKLTGRAREAAGTWREDMDATLFSLIWFLSCYIPFVLLWIIDNRVTYPFYAVMFVPAFCVGASYFITREWFPRKVAYVYVAACFALFFFYYPVKDFLPLWLRVMLSR